jgi:Leucine Rich Repeat (LRR) protein
MQHRTLFLSAEEPQQFFAKKITGNTLNLSEMKLLHRDVPDIIKCIRQYPEITELDLSSNLIGFAGVIDLAAFLENNKTLTSLNLNFNYIDNIGVNALASALEKNQTLTSLDLMGNFICNEDVRILASSLKNNQTLRWLDLSDNRKSGDEGAKAIVCALEKNETLTFFRMSNIQQNIETMPIQESTALSLISLLYRNRMLQIQSVVGCDLMLRLSFPMVLVSLIQEYMYSSRPQKSNISLERCFFSLPKNDELKRSEIALLKDVMDTTLKKTVHPKKGTMTLKISDYVPYKTTICTLFNRSFRHRKVLDAKIDEADCIVISGISEKNSDEANQTVLEGMTENELNNIVSASRKRPRSPAS